MRTYLLIAAILLLLGETSPLWARDAAFIEPGANSGKGSTGGDALIADPKAFDAGESTVGITRRVSLFFVNTSGMPLQITEMTTTGDGNVTLQTENSDCKTTGKIAPYSRCTVALTITPTSAGNWSVEILAMHDGAGRIARATVNGKAGMDAKSATRAEGLNLSSRDMKPLDFGDVEVGGAPAVRTALMVNDSPESITIKAIDLIAVDQGLERLLTGCTVDQVLAPDASCPITLKWSPTAAGNIATDLIMRHTGKIGFTVIPIRGRGTGGSGLASLAAPVSHNTGKTPSPPTAAEVASVAGNLPPLDPVSTYATPAPKQKKAASPDQKVYLIGVVGQRGILQYDGITKMLEPGAEADIAGITVKLSALAEREARIIVDGQPRTVKLAASSYRPPARSNKEGGGKVKDTPISTDVSLPVSSNSQPSSGK